MGVPGAAQQPTASNAETRTKVSVKLGMLLSLYLGYWQKRDSSEDSRH